MTCPTRTYYYSSGEIWGQDWLVNGLPHKTNGPAHIIYNPNGEIEFEQWYLNGKLHRKDGPASISYHESGEITVDAWFLNGKRIYPDEWLKDHGYKWPLTEDQQTELLLRFR